MMLANNDRALVWWLFGIINEQPTKAGRFLRNLAATAFAADWENYGILRPALLTIKAKYPEYKWTPPSGKEDKMALSDYLTGEEWDACYYVAMVAHRGENFGDSMQQTIVALLKNGYKFTGLDEYGMKVEQVEGGINAPKTLIFLGNPNKIETIPILENGRRFLKLFAPALVVESDEIWTALVAKYKRLGGSM